MFQLVFTASCSVIVRLWEEWLPSLTWLLGDYIQWDLFLVFSLKCGETMFPELSLVLLCSSPLTSSVTFHWNSCSALVRRNTKVDELLQIWSHSCWIKKHSDFPQCAGYMLADCCGQQESHKSGYFSWRAITAADLAKMLQSGLTVPLASSLSAFTFSLCFSVSLSSH